MPRHSAKIIPFLLNIIPFLVDWAFFGRITSKYRHVCGLCNRFQKLKNQINSDFRCLFRKTKTQPLLVKHDPIAIATIALSAATLTTVGSPRTSNGLEPTKQRPFGPSSKKPFRHQRDGTWNPSTHESPMSPTAAHCEQISAKLHRQRALVLGPHLRRNTRPNWRDSHLTFCPVNEDAKKKLDITRPKKHMYAYMCVCDLCMFIYILMFYVCISMFIYTFIYMFIDICSYI